MKLENGLCMCVSWAGDAGVAVAWVVGAEVRAVQGQRKQEGARQAPGPRLFALCPAVARRVCAACHQLCTEEKRHAHTVNSGH